MAKSKTITVPPSMSPEEALETARRQFEGDGFSWEQQSPTEAFAYERGKKTTGKTSWNLRIGVRAEPGQLTVTRETNGAQGYLFPNAGAVTQTFMFSKFNRMVKQLGDSFTS